MMNEEDRESEIAKTCEFSVTPVRKIRISLCQAISCSGDVEANLMYIKKHLEDCSASSDVIVFLEVFPSPFFQNR